MIVANAAEVVQLTIGAVIGTAVSVNLRRFNLSLMDPKTRWKASGVIVTFLFSFLVLSDLILN
ncbi:MAG: hypothetical protein FD131_4589 [Rhodocyclaceae bacterium]|jgi:hypothetical protein|nr:MAG: hypothetical protein FD131_4589 [Rhodocyclaceae bacterium]